MALVLIHPFQAMNCRSDRLGWWRLPPNRLVWASLLALVGAQWAATTWPPLRTLLGTVALSSADWVMLLVAVLWPVLLMEGVKLRRRLRLAERERPAPRTADAHRARPDAQCGPSAPHLGRRCPSSGVRLFV